MSDLPWLVMDTAGPVAVVAIVRGGSVLHEERLTETRRHAEGLVDAIDRAALGAGVTLADLAGVAVGRGPGSFIGVRTGIATAKGLAMARGIPLVGIPTLLALASDPALPDGAGLAVLDAKRGEVYAQRVERSAGVARPTEPPAPLAPTEAVARGAGCAFVVGSGLDLALVDVAVRLALPGPGAAGLALALRHAALVDETDTLVPDYCRAPDARLPPPA